MKIFADMHFNFLPRIFVDTSIYRKLSLHPGEGSRKVHTSTYSASYASSPHVTICYSMLHCAVCMSPLVTLCYLHSPRYVTHLHRDHLQISASVDPQMSVRCFGKQKGTVPATGRYTFICCLKMIFFTFLHLVPIP